MKTILVATLGKTPQVLVETVWALAHQKTLPDEVIAIAMQNHAGEAKKSLLGDNGGWYVLLRKLRRAGFEIEGRLKFAGITVAWDSNGTINDLRTEAENHRCANFLFRLLQDKTAESTGDRLIVSLSGGRKSLSALVTTTMVLLARPHDEMIHLIVKRQWENDGRYHFPTDAKGFSLFTVPFVKTRGLLKGCSVDKIRTFEECLGMTQDCALNDGEYPVLAIDMKDGTVRVGVRMAKMDPVRLIFLWMVFRDKTVDRTYMLQDAIKGTVSRFCETEKVDALPSWFKVLRAKVAQNRVPECRQVIQGVKNDLEKLGLSPLLLRRLIPHGKKSLNVYDTAYPSDKLVVMETEFSDRFYHLVKTYG